MNRWRRQDKDAAPAAPPPTAPNPGIPERVEKWQVPVRGQNMDPMTPLPQMTEHPFSPWTPGDEQTPNPGGETVEQSPPRESFALDKSLADIVDAMNNVDSPIATPTEIVALRQAVKSLNFRLVTVTRERDAATRALRRVLGIGVDGTNGAETDFGKADDLLSALGLETDY